jgi:osmotically inducible protein OsmC
MASSADSRAEAQGLHDPVVRHGRVSWLTHPPRGEARISVESRAFGAIPVALSARDPIAHEASPGELLAVTHGMFMATALSGVLEEGGSPADELIVIAACVFAGPVTSRTLLAVELRVRGRVPGLEARRFEQAVAAARERYLHSSGLCANVPVQVQAVLDRVGRRA